MDKKESNRLHEIERDRIERGIAALNEVNAIYFALPPELQAILAIKDVAKNKEKYRKLIR